MEKDVRILRYEAAVSILPFRLRKAALALPWEQQAQAEELRLRSGRGMTAVLPGGEVLLDAVVEAEELDTLCDIATEFSRYAAVETLRDGFVTVRGGFRVGLCGTAVMKDGVNTNLKEFSSASIRIAGERKGIAKDIAEQLFCDGVFADALILSPPGGGKTTFLRDLVRSLSTGGRTFLPQRVSLIDERGEVAVCYRGMPQMDVGPHTDVLDACPKAIGIPMVLRAMNPQIIAVDEITAAEDLKALVMASGCGAGLLATVHASDVEDMRRKPLYRKLLEEEVFRYVIRIARTENGRRYEIEEMRC